MRFVLSCLFSVVAASAAVVYTNDFNTVFTAGGVSALWSDTSTTTYIKGENYRGQLGNTTVTLTLSGLPSNTGTITFDLHIIDSWDGDCGGGIGPDSASFNFGLGSTSRTYSRNGGCTQSYPSAGSSATAGRTTFYGASSGLFGGLDVYSWSLPYSGSGGVATFDFTGAGLQGIGDESWGLDNISVDADVAGIPEPSSLALLGAGAVVLALRRRL